MGRVSVLLPTTGRPDRAEACIRNLRETADVEVICAVDADHETALRVAPLVDRLLVSAAYRGCSQAWNDCLAEATCDAIVFGADDLRWESGWLEAAEANFETGFVGFNDGHWGEELSTHYMMSREFIVSVLGGVVAWPAYKHSFNDLEVNQRARAANRYAWCEDAHVYHEHWLFGDREKDDTDSRRLPEHSNDQRIYDKRRAAGFPVDYSPVITA